MGSTAEVFSTPLDNFGASVNKLGNHECNVVELDKAELPGLREVSSKNSRTSKLTDKTKVFDFRWEAIDALGQIAAQLPDQFRVKISDTLLKHIADPKPESDFRTRSDMKPDDCPKSVLQNCLLLFAKEQNQLGMSATLQLMSKYFPSDSDFARPLLHSCLHYPEFIPKFCAELPLRINDENRQEALEALDNLIVTTNNPEQLGSLVDCVAEISSTYEAAIKERNEVDFANGMASDSDVAIIANIAKKMLLHRAA